MRSVILFCCIFLGFAFSARACLDLSSETRTFFKILPERLLAKEMVAEVEVLSTNLVGGNYRLTRVKVIKSLKGARLGNEFLVRSGTSSCNRDPELSVGQVYFIAGSQDKKGVFIGSWPSDAPIGLEGGPK